MDRMDLTLERTTQGYLGQKVDYQVPLSIYPARSGVIIVNAPGVGEPQDGRRDRYDAIGRHLQARGVGAFISHSPPLPDAQFKYPDEPYSYRDASWNQVAVESMAHVIEHALERAPELCGSSSPVLYLAGFSAGGSVCGAVAHRYPQVQRLLFISTYDSVGDYFYAGIREFTGEVYLTYGSQDPMAGFLAYLLSFTAPGLKALHAQMVPECDHGFRGATNGRILSKAYLWAFAGDQTFPSPEGGLLLYED